jgi:hypothetical protein
MAQKMPSFMNRFQNILAFGGCTNPHFKSDGIGKIGTSGFVLGFLGGLHLAFAILSTFLLYTDKLTIENTFLLQTLVHWSLYVVCLSSFHFLEFFSTAVSQPALLSYECK